ncbi:hypothetical protein [Peribacillus simplex]|nr:hypothetical protein [Peribacillus simplex]WHY98181.1 hypothetical protein QNH37_02995 [Peribacillus simplex]
MAIELLKGDSEERPLGCYIVENHKVWIKEEGNEKKSKLFKLSSGSCA